jgi:hypothetical protein
MAKFNGWIFKNKWGSFSIYFSANTRKEVIQKIGLDRWEAWKAQGHKIVKFKIVEVA